MEKLIILLNGPSCSGKSTLSRSLQDLIEEKQNEKYGIISIDDFLKMTAEDVIYEEDVFGISGEMCDKAAEMLENHPGVIIDHVITSERIFFQLREMLCNYSMALIHVTCPLAILKEREKERGNRCPGSAEASYAYLYPKEGYDLTINTNVMTPGECSLLIYEKLLR